MDKVIIDTNFLMLPFSFKVDIFTEFQRILDKPKLFFLEESIIELEKINQVQKGKDKEYSKMALFYLKKAPITILKTVKHLKEYPTLSKIRSVDDKIVYIAEKGGYLVATQDKLLKEKLKKKDISIITLRQKKYLIKI